MALRSQPRAASEARHELRAFLFDTSSTVRETAELLTTELVANSVAHGMLREDEDIELSFVRDPRVLRVEVRDPGRGFALPSGATRGNGWGLSLVDQMSARWGTARDGSTCVWFELDLGE